MKKFFGKVGSALSAIAMLGVTLSGATVTLDNADVSLLGGGIAGMGTSILQIFFQLAPYLLGFAAVILVIGYIKGWTKMKTGSGKRRR